MTEPITPSEDKFAPPELECPEGCTPAPGDCLSALDEYYTDTMAVYSDTLVDAVDAAVADYDAAMLNCGPDVQCQDAANQALLQATILAQAAFDSAREQLDAAYQTQAAQQCCECEGEEG